MMRFHILWLSMMMLLSVGSVGCGTVLGRAAADVLVPVEEENQLGRELVKEIEAEVRLHPDAEVQRYVRELGENIARGVREVPQGIRFRFVVVDDPNTINAFAIPGGHIYIYSGLIRAADNEAELAAVISHEIAHVTRRHVAQRLVAAYGAETVAQMALGEQPGIIAQLVALVASQGFMLKYSRDQESEADEYGLQYLVQANYDPGGFVTFFQKLEGQPRVPTFLSSHPSPTQRITVLKRAIREMDQRPTRTEEARLQEMKQRL